MVSGGGFLLSVFCSHYSISVRGWASPDSGCKLLESCSLECQKVAKILPKNFKKLALNFLIFLCKR